MKSYYYSLLLCLIFMLSLGKSCFAQSQSITIGKRYFIHSDILKEDHGGRYLLKNKNRELTPAGPDGPTTSFGGAEDILRFLSEELVPYVDDHFLTHPFRILAGHSFGGLFSLYTIRNMPRLFQAIIALSSSLGRNGEQLVGRDLEYTFNILKK